MNMMGGGGNPVGGSPMTGSDLYRNTIDSGFEPVL